MKKALDACFFRRSNAINNAFAMQILLSDL